MTLYLLTLRVSKKFEKLCLKAYNLSFVPRKVLDADSTQSKEYTVNAPITFGLYTVWDANNLELTITFFTYREKTLR